MGFPAPQEPRRLFGRYMKDLWVFGRSIVKQWWQMQFHTRTGVRLKVSATAIWSAAASEARRRFGLCLCHIHLKTLKPKRRRASLAAALHKVPDRDRQF